MTTRLLGLTSVLALAACTGCGGDDEGGGKAGGTQSGGSGGSGGSGTTAGPDPIILEDFSDLRTNAV